MSRTFPVTIQYNQKIEGWMTLSDNALKLIQSGNWEFAIGGKIIERDDKSITKLVLMEVSLIPVTKEKQSNGH